MDTVFFFETEKEALEYLELSRKFHEASGIRIDKDFPSKLEKMTKEEHSRFGFHEPGEFRLPHKVIIRPYKINPNEPYWVETKELIWPSVTGQPA